MSEGLLVCLMPHKQLPGCTKIATADSTEVQTSSLLVHNQIQN